MLKGHGDHCGSRKHIALEIKQKVSHPESFSHSGGQEINHILERLDVSFIALILPVKSMGKAGRLMIR